jgi:hypothetical protein
MTCIKEGILNKMKNEKRNFANEIDREHINHSLVRRYLSKVGSEKFV